MLKFSQIKKRVNIIGLIFLLFVLIIYSVVISTISSVFEIQGSFFVPFSSYIYSDVDTMVEKMQIGDDGSTFGPMQNCEETVEAFDCKNTAPKSGDIVVFRFLKKDKILPDQTSSMLQYHFKAVKKSDKFLLVEVYTRNKFIS